MMGQGAGMAGPKGLPFGSAMGECHRLGSLPSQAGASAHGSLEYGKSAGGAEHIEQSAAEVSADRRPSDPGSAMTISPVEARENAATLAIAVNGPSTDQESGGRSQASGPPEIRMPRTSTGLAPCSLSEGPAWTSRSDVLGGEAVSGQAAVGGAPSAWRRRIRWRIPPFPANSSGRKRVSRR